MYICTYAGTHAQKLPLAMRFIETESSKICTDPGDFLLSLDKRTTSGDPLKVLLEMAWEADDVKEECARLEIPCVEMSEEELRALDTSRFIYSTFLCDMGIVLAQLRKAGMAHLIPDKYPPEFAPFYRRFIQEKRLGLLQASDLPMFVKPRGHHQTSDGMIIRSMDQLPLPHMTNTLCYTAEVVDFGAKYRLFVGKNRIYGTGLLVAGKEPEDNGESLSAFTDCVVKQSCGYYAVDVAYLETQNTWAVVEVNPPFAMDDCGVDIQSYMQFCIDTCENIRASRYENKVSVLTDGMG
jgi:hypothetical protein